MLTPKSLFQKMLSFILRLIEDVGEAALSAVLPVEVRSHEDASPTLLCRALTAQPVDLPVVIHLVVLEHSELNFAVLVLDLLGGGIILLLPLLATSTKPQHQVEGGFFLDVIVRKSSAIFQLFSSKYQTLLIWRNALLVLDLRLDILDGITWLDFKGDRLAREGLDENLHDGSVHFH